MDLIQISQRIKADINAYCEASADTEPRAHLGASRIGHKCERFLWYEFRWMFKEKFDGRMRRLFERGRDEEQRIFKLLEGIGCKLLDNPAKQESMAACSGHFGGSRDGALVLPYREVAGSFLLEGKTHSLKSFKELESFGVIASKPMHWEQMCTYGVGFDLQYGIYFGVCKDNDELHIEALELDHALGNKAIDRGRRIISSPDPPPRISANPGWYECQYCAARDVCHFGAEPLKNCRSCQNSRPDSDAKWFCTLYKEIIPDDFQKRGCEKWVPLK